MTFASVSHKRRRAAGNATVLGHSIGASFFLALISEPDTTLNLMLKTFKIKIKVAKPQNTRATKDAGQGL